MRSLTVQTSDECEQGANTRSQAGNHTLLCEKLDECGFEGRDVRADSAVLQLDLETDAPKVREPAQFLVGFERCKLARI
jgi:hypothetical protein